VRSIESSFTHSFTFGVQHIIRSLSSGNRLHQSFAFLMLRSCNAIDLVLESVYRGLRAAALSGKNGWQAGFGTVFFIKGGSEIESPDRRPCSSICRQHATRIIPGEAYFTLLTRNASSRSRAATRRIKCIAGAVMRRVKDHMSVAVIGAGFAVVVYRCTHDSRLKRGGKTRHGCVREASQQQCGRDDISHLSPPSIYSPDI
jgi:hypothetical protein